MTTSETAELIERYVCARIAVELALEAGMLAELDRLNATAKALRTRVEQALSLGSELTWAHLLTLQSLRAPRTEHFTDEYGRAAVRYLDDDLALGIAAGSEFLRRD